MLYNVAHCVTDIRDWRNPRFANAVYNIVPLVADNVFRPIADIGQDFLYGLAYVIADKLRTGLHVEY